MLTKEKVQAFLKEIEVDDLVQNFQVMGNDVYIDMTAHSPAMHEKKKLEAAMKQAFASEFGEEIILKLKIASPEPTEIQQSQIKGKQIKGIQNIIAIASGKGGVGKSTVAANLAVTLAKMGFKVGVLDADIYGPSIPTMLNLKGRQPMLTTINGQQKILPIEQYGIKTLSIGFLADEKQAVVWRGPMASSALRQFITDSHWGDLDYLVIDLPPGTGDIHLTLAQLVPITGAVIVTTPQDVAKADVVKAIGMFRLPQINVPILGLVENMAYFVPPDMPNKKYFIFGQGAGQSLCDEYNLPYLAQLPINASVCEHGDSGLPVVMSNDPAAAAFEELAQRTAQQVAIRNANLAATQPIVMK